MEELVQYKLSRNYIPGTDRVSKLVAKNQYTIDLITNSLLNVPSGTYTTGGSMLNSGTACDILYMPRSADLPRFPPVMVEIQHTVTRNFMCQVIQYCLNVYERSHVLPILLIICTSETEPEALRDLFKPTQTYPYLLETPCGLFATNCFMLTKGSIDPFIDNSGIGALDPLVAFAHFLTSGQQSILSIDRWDDPTIINLYSVAMEMVKNDRDAENDNEAMSEESSNTPQTTPMELPEDFEGTPSTNSKNKQLIEFVNDWKQINNGRMNWSACWEEGKKAGFFSEFSNGHSLKATYHKVKNNF